MAEDVKVFISWSGPFARGVAQTLREWLPNLSDRILPWMSDEDIDAGTRPMTEISEELNGTSFGIIVVTQDNHQAPWLNFEAGALSKQVDGQKSRVAPLLIDMATPNDLTGPLTQYQAQLFKRSGVLKVIQSLASVAEVKKELIGERFEKFWPDLERDIRLIKERNARREPVAPIRSQLELMDEALTRIRSIERSLATVTEDPLLSAMFSSDYTRQSSTRDASRASAIFAILKGRSVTTKWHYRQGIDTQFVFFDNDQTTELLESLNEDAEMLGVNVKFRNARSESERNMVNESLRRTR